MGDRDDFLFRPIYDLQAGNPAEMLDIVGDNRVIQRQGA